MTRGKMPGAVKKALLALELVILLGVTPLLALTQSLYAYRHALLLGGCAYTVWRLSAYISWRFLLGNPEVGWWRAPLLRGLGVWILAAIYVLVVEPENFFIFPQTRPGLWLLVLFLYPVLSVLPQEIIYRVYIFEVHAGLWSRPWQPVLVSAVTFGWVHIIFAGWFAVATTAVGGAVLGMDYQRCRKKPGALWRLWLEHTLYGLAMFTVGLGRYFFLSR